MFLIFFRIWDWDVFNLFGSGRPEVFYKKDVLSNFAKFTRKHRCQSLLLNKVVGLRSATLLRRRLWHRYFPVNFAYFLRTPFLHNTFGASKLSLLISGVPVLILMTFWNYKTAFKRIQNKNGIMSMSTNYINSYWSYYEYKQYKQLLELLKSFFQQSTFFEFFKTRIGCSLIFLIFRERHPSVVLSMFLNYCQVSGSCSYKIVLSGWLYGYFQPGLKYNRLKKI